MRNRTLRKDRKYDELKNAIESLKSKELCNYIYVIGLIHLKHTSLFYQEDWDDFLVMFKDLAIQLEIDRKINYAEFRKIIAEWIDENVYPEYKYQLFRLVRESYNIKNHENLYKKTIELFREKKEQKYE